MNNKQHNGDAPHALARQEVAPSVRKSMEGEDLWRAWELSWLSEDGGRRCGVLEIHVPADSPNLVESKSLKLYLFSLRERRYRDSDALCEQIAQQLSAAVDAQVKLRMLDINSPELLRAPCHGLCLDELADSAVISDGNSSAALLEGAVGGGKEVSESLHTNLFRTLCPLSGQPDWATISIRYLGVAINHAQLLTYLLNYASHQDFHEHCVESVFADLWTVCKPRELMVEGFFLRRGGIDICPRRFSRNHYLDARGTPKPLTRQ